MAIHSISFRLAGFERQEHVIRDESDGLVGKPITYIRRHRALSIHVTIRVLYQCLKFT